MAQEISGSNNLLVGLFSEATQTFVFELPGDDLLYDERIIVISAEENPNTFNILYNIRDSVDFWMPSKFGKVHYKAYKLTHRESLLGVVLIDSDNPSELSPYVEKEYFVHVLANFLMVVRSQQLYNGRELLRGLFKFDEPVGARKFNERVKQFLLGERLPWIDHACNLIAQHLNVDACTVFWKHSEPRLVLAGSTHCKSLQQAFYNINTPSLTTKCFNSDTPICLTDVGHSPDNSHIFDEDIVEHHKSWLGHPIRAKGIQIGVLRLLHKRSQTGKLTNFFSSDMENARLVSNYLAKCYEELNQYSQMYKAKNEAIRLKQQAERTEKTTSAISS